MTIAFTHGVASGDPRPDGIVLWTRAVDRDDERRPVELACVIADAEGREVQRLAGRSRPERDYTVRVIATGLDEGSAYTYRFESNDGKAESPLGRFRTLPRDPDSITFAVVSCAKHNAGYFHAYAKLAERDDIAFVLHLGDYIYEAANVPPASQTPGADIGRDMDPPHECRRLADYRRRYAQYRSDPALQALHAAHPFIATIDDHELADNAWRGGAQEHRPEEHGPWAERRQAAMSAWEEWLPVRARPTEGAPIHTSLELGDLARLVVLEARLDRSDPAAHDGVRTQLGHAQLAWLRAQAAKESDGWLVVGSPSPLFDVVSPDLSEAAIEALLKLKMIELGPDGAVRPFFDSWGGYPDELDELREILAAAPAQPIVLSGDVHVACAADLDLGERGKAVEWTTTSLTSQNLDDKCGWPRRTRSITCEQDAIAALPELRWANFDDHGFMIVTLSADQAECEWWMVDCAAPEPRYVFKERHERRARRTAVSYG